MKAIRCAIYTRKSSEEGLEQDFNSLDAQREACEAFVASQRHEGWTVLPEAYDDGGISGGTMERPALQRLLGEIRAGRVDAVVVYKVDRLTRSLGDFARIVETFDAHGVSFVSVTQQFNTTSSMGRLTLNVLLSFAQFEREVTGERIRDKIAASKKKGMWMGGHVPLGYDVRDRKLVINPAEAKTVRKLFHLYLELGCVTQVKDEAQRLGLRTKPRLTRTGKAAGGTTFSRGHLYRILSNPVYVGETCHKTATHPGEHKAIIERDTWDRVQTQLGNSAKGRRVGRNAREPSLLAGMLYDADGNTFTPSHAVKNGRRYRYYVERALTLEGRRANPNGKRLPAGEIERVVIDTLCGLFDRPGELIDACGLTGAGAKSIDSVSQLAIGLKAELKDGLVQRRREILTRAVHRVLLEDNAVIVEIRTAGLHDLLGVEGNDEPDAIHRITVPMEIRSRGVEMKLVVEPTTSEPAPNPDPALIKAVVRAHDWWNRLLNGEAATLGEIAGAEAVSDRYVRRIMELAFLAPDITVAILDGRQPADLTAERLTKLPTLPHDWNEQRHLLGFD